MVNDKGERHAVRYVMAPEKLVHLAAEEAAKTAPDFLIDELPARVARGPVTFHLKTDPHGALQYGLIAEEVAKVYPELVIRDEKGRIDGLRYDELAPMLLNEVQQQAAQIRDLKLQQLRTLQQVAELKSLNHATQVALRKLQPKDELVAQR